MKANELRIGNLFYYGDRIAEVSCIYRTHFNCEEYITRIQFGNSLQNNFEPIPLTEEFLLKFGFEKKEGSYNRFYYSIDGMDIRIDGDEFETEIGECLYKTIDYVHQLQNLYFALTNEELTMK